MTLAKPIGVRFARGNDGAAYVYEADDNLGNSDERLKVRHACLQRLLTLGGKRWPGSHCTLHIAAAHAGDL